MAAGPITSPALRTTSPRAHFLAAAADVLAETRLELEGDPRPGAAVAAVERVRALNHDDAVGTLGHRGACHDASGLTGCHDDAGDVVARADVGDDVQRDGRVGACAGEIGGAHGKAVHRGVVERRDVDVAASVGCEHAAE